MLFCDINKGGWEDVSPLLLPPVEDDTLLDTALEYSPSRVVMSGAARTLLVSFPVASLVTFSPVLLDLVLTPAASDEAPVSPSRSKSMVSRSAPTLKSPKVSKESAT